MNSLPGIGKGDVSAIARECMSSEEFRVLPINIQVADTESSLELFEGILRFYHPHQNLIGRYYYERQQPHERWEKYLN